MVRLGYIGLDDCPAGLGNWPAVARNRIKLLWKYEESPLKGLYHERDFTLYFFWWGEFFLGAISLGRVVLPYPNIVINLPRTYEKLPWKENHIGLAVSEILRYKQKDRQTFCYFILLDFSCHSFFIIALPTVPISTAGWT